MFFSFVIENFKRTEKVDNLSEGLRLKMFS